MSPQKGTFNGSLVRALGQQHTLHVVCPIAWTDQVKSRGIKPSIESRALTETISISYPTFWYPPKILRSQFDHFLDWSTRSHIANLAQTFRPEAVLSYWAHPDASVAVRIAGRLGIPAVTMVGGSDVLLLSRTGSRRRKILDTLCRSDAVIAVSEDIANRIVNDGVPQAKVHVVRRGIDESLFFPGNPQEACRKLNLPADERVILGVGRLVSVKDWPTLIDACFHLKQSGMRNFRCDLVGSGDQQSSLTRQIQHLALQDVVQLRGAQLQSSLGNWYRSADVIVLPSLSEGIPNVLLEAQACGTPFVASNVGGIPEIVDPQHDRLVPPGSPESLATAIRPYLETPRTVRTNHCRAQSWAESAARVTRILETCLHGGSALELSSPRKSLDEQKMTQLQEAGSAS